jgi:hypothetical protein
MRYRASLLLLALASLLAIAAFDAPAPNAEQPHPGFNGPADALTRLGFTDSQADAITSRVLPVDPQKFKYADDVNTPNTIDFPWTTVTGFGAAEVQFDVPTGLAREFRCNEAYPDGFRTFCTDGGPQPGVAYAVFITTFEGGSLLDDMGNYWVNLSWPTNIGDNPGWQPQGPFVGDTWQQASRITYITYGPDPWSMHVSQLQDGALIDDPDSHSFALLGGNTLLEFSPSGELMQGAPTWDAFSYGFAIHIHDGTFGSCPTCESTISAIPPVPRDTLIGWDVGDVIIAGAVDATPSPTTPASSSTDSGTTGSDTTGSDSSSGSDTTGSTTGSDTTSTTGGSDTSTGGGDSADSSTSSGGTDMTLLLGLLAGLGLMGAGGLYLWNNGLLLAGPGTGLTEEDVERSPTGAAGPTAPDPEIIAALRGTMGVDEDLETQTRQADLAWESLVLREQGVQERLIKNYQDLLAAFAQAWARFKAGAQAFGEAYLSAYNGSDALQQTARDWQVRQIGAKAIDIAVACVMLVRGVAQLGSAGFRFLRGLRGAADEAVGLAGAAAGTSEYAAAIAKAESAIEASPVLREAAEQLAATGRRDELVQLAAMADEAGIAFEQWFVQRKELIEELGGSIFNRQRMATLFEAMARSVLEARGWVQATAEQRNLISTLLVNGRGLINGTASLTPQEISAFRALVNGTDDFFGWVAKLYDEVSEVAGAADETVDFFGLVCSADDVSFLEALWTAIGRSGDDLTQLPNILRETLGPAKVAAIEAGESAAGGAALTTTGAVIAGSSGGGPQGPVQLGAIGSLDVYMGQYGITNDSFGGNLWDFVTSPVETSTGIWHTLWAQSEWNEFIENHEDDVKALGPSVANAIGALEAMQMLVRGDRLSSPTGTIGAPLRELQQVMRGMEQTFNSAPPAWQNQHRAEYDAKRAHIVQKINQIGESLQALNEFAFALTKFIDQLEALRRDEDGTHREAIEMLDPDIAVTLVQISFLLEGTAWRAFGGGQREQQTLTPEEIRAASERNQLWLEQYYQELDAIPEDYDSEGE